MQLPCPLRSLNSGAATESRCAHCGTYECVGSNARGQPRPPWLLAAGPILSFGIRPQSCFALAEGAHVRARGPACFFVTAMASRALHLPHALCLCGLFACAPTFYAFQSGLRSALSLSLLRRLRQTAAAFRRDISLRHSEISRSTQRLLLICITPGKDRR